MLALTQTSQGWHAAYSRLLDQQQDKTAPPSDNLDWGTSSR